MNFNRRGLIGSIVTHGLVLLLLLLGSLTYPDPPPEEEGILVNFGIDETGFGPSEPAGMQSEEDAPVVEEIDVEEVEETYVPEITQPEVTEVDVTQDVEEVKVKEDPQPTEEELQRQRDEAERIRKQQEEEERIRKEQEAERQRQLEEERKRQEQEQQANRLNQIGQNAFGNSGSGNTTGGEGETSGDGNQGVETGSPDADRYGDGRGLGNGNSFSLGGRKVDGDLPLPDVSNCEVTSKIVVRVEIQVDPSGKVVAANVIRATFSDDCIWTEVVNAAKKTKFTADENASFRQKGWIEYTIQP